MAQTKQARILSALESGDRLTHLKALAYGTHRLAAVVFELRKKGYDIQVEEKYDSMGTRFAEYSLPAAALPDQYSLAA